MASSKNTITGGVKLLLVPSACIFFLDYIYRVYDEFDWGHPFTKLLCFGAMAAMVVGARSSGFIAWISSAFAAGHHRRTLQYLGLAMVLLLAVFMLHGYPARYLPQILSPPRVDIGYTTVHAAELLFRELQNPYASQTINIRPELPPEFRGFHYGPLMIIAYFPALIFPVWGFKLMSAIFTVVSSGLLCLMVRKKGNSMVETIESALFALTLFFLSNRFWYENFTQGANDIFPVMLILVSLLYTKREQFLLAGLFAGLSFSAKFSPALFLFVFFIRRDYRPKFFYGWVWGVLPMLAFFLWNPAALLNNVFLCRLTLKFDSTSLYSITPERLHYLFSLAQLLAVIFAVARNFKKGLIFDSLVAEFILLLIFIEVTFKEIHGNHFIWFMPLMALHLSRCLRGARHEGHDRSICLQWSGFSAPTVSVSPENHP